MNNSMVWGVEGTGTITIHLHDAIFEPSDVFVHTASMLLHRWELLVLHYHEIMVIYPYPFLVLIA